MEMTNNGYTVTHNGVTMSKPDWMSDNYWFRYEAPRVGKRYASGKKAAITDLYGMDYEQPTHGVEEMEDGCGSGACAI